MKHIFLLFAISIAISSYSQDTLHLYSNDDDVQGGQNVCLPVYVNNFNRIEVLQFSINFHPRKLYFTEIANINPSSNLKMSDFGLSQVDKGIIPVIFVDPNSGGNILPDSSILFEVCFNVIGEPNTIAPFNISEYPREIEVYGNNRFLVGEESISRHKILAPSVGRIYARTCVNQPLSGNQGELRFTVYGTNSSLVYSITKIGDPTFQENGQMNEGQVIRYGNLESGFYEILVADVFGNEIIKTVEIETGKGWTVPLDFTLPTCHDSEDGSVEIERIVGGIEPYTISWSDGSVVKDRIQNLKEGKYYVTIEDHNRCKFSKSVTLKNPEPIYTINEIKPTCSNISDGEIRLEVANIPRFSDSTLLFGFHIDSLVRDTSFHLENVGAGDYNFIIGDEKGCFHEYNYTLKSKSHYSIEIVDISPTACRDTDDGRISFETYIDGSKSDEVDIILEPYYGAINDSIAYYSISNLRAREYKLIMSSDSINCISDTTFTIERADSLYINTIELGDERCADDSTGYIVVEAVGGTGNEYSFDWSHGARGDSILNLGQGLYTLTLTDSLGCAVTGDYLISKGTEIYLKDTIFTEPLCHDHNDGAIRVVAGSREGIASDTLIFQWNNPNAVSNGDTSYLNNITSDLYILTVTDNYCSKEFNLRLKSPDALEIHFDSIQGFDCDNSGKGFVNTTISGGTQPYSYSWSNGDNTKDIDDLRPGTYILTVTDSHSCTSVDSFQVAEYEDVEYLINTFSISCEDGNDGIIEITIENPEIVKKVTVSKNSIVLKSTNGDLYIDSLSTGNYEVHIENNLGCIYTESVSLIAPEFNYSAMYTNVSCPGNTDGVIKLTFEDINKLASASLIGSSHSVDTMDNMLIFYNLDTGLYQLNLIDTADCELSEIINIQTDSIKIETYIDFPSCFGSDDASITLNYTSHYGLDTFIWHPLLLDTIIYEMKSIKIEGLTAGKYYFSLIDSNLCTYSDSILVIEPDSLSAEFTLEPEKGNQSDGTVEVLITGGTQPYTYIWSIPDSGNKKSVNGLSAGNYQLVVIDNNGCRKEFSFTIDRISNIKSQDIDDINVTLYPNPVRDELIIKSKSLKDIQYEIINTTGELILQGAIGTAHNNSTVSDNFLISYLDISKFPNGFYIIYFYNGETKFSEKFIKQR